MPSDLEHRSKLNKYLFIWLLGRLALNVLWKHYRFLSNLIQFPNPSGQQLSYLKCSQTASQSDKTLVKTFVHCLIEFSLCKILINFPSIPSPISEGFHLSPLFCASAIRRFQTCTDKVQSIAKKILLSPRLTKLIKTVIKLLRSLRSPLPLCQISLRNCSARSFNT